VPKAFQILLTTIGLGDVMPNNIHDSVFFCGILLSGLALISSPVLSLETPSRNRRRICRLAGSVGYYPRAARNIIYLLYPLP
jgi:hypothetical protein